MRCTHRGEDHSIHHTPGSEYTAAVDDNDSLCVHGRSSGRDDVLHGGHGDGRGDGVLPYDLDESRDHCASHVSSDASDHLHDHDRFFRDGVHDGVCCHCDDPAPVPLHYLRS